MSSSHVKFLKASILRNVVIKDKFKNIVTSESKKTKKTKKNPHTILTRTKIVNEMGNQTSIQNQ